MNEFCAGIYDICKRSVKKVDTVPILTQHQNCDSKNFVAIADVNRLQYERLRQAGDVRSEHYKEEWLYYQELARQYEENEYFKRSSINLRSLQSKNPKKLWEIINWKDDRHDEITEIPPEVVFKFFKGIFQSEVTKSHPVISSVEDRVQKYNNFCNITDNSITLDEIKDAGIRLKKGSSMDGIPPEIIKVLPHSMLLVVKKLFNGVFSIAYPDAWRTQILLPTPKKGHTTSEPKLRGVAVGPALSRAYDVIMDSRFCKWFKPNAEQAGFRKGQGCNLQIFAMLLTIDLMKKQDKELFVGLLDYEKAFDFTNRVKMIEMMMDNNIGAKYVHNWFETYKSTSFVPKNSTTAIGDAIETWYGVTQGKHSSANIFSFFVSDMARVINHENIDSLHPYGVFQLADDTTVLADSLLSFTARMGAAFSYSEAKLLKVNMGKTKFLHCWYEPKKVRISIDGVNHIDPVDDKDGYNWLGIYLHHSNDITKIIRYNLNKKKFNICKFYSWLEVNESISIKIKLQVLYSCMFSSIMYSSETWGDITDDLKEEICTIERKALRRVLGVKSGTANDLVYAELQLPDISAVIKDRQFKFFEKIRNLHNDDAVVKGVLHRYASHVNDFFPQNMLKYYEELQDNNVKTNIQDRECRIRESPKTMCKRHVNMSLMNEPKILYKSMHNDEDRITITRWRLSSHPLFIETGRRKRPKIPDTERKCMICLVIEDEEHAIFHCAAHISVRYQFRELLSRYKTVKDIFDPQTVEDMGKIATMLKAIERNMEKLKLKR